LEGIMEDYTPFELDVRSERTILRLHRTKGPPIIVEEDKIKIILDAIVKGWDISIDGAIIDGKLDIKSIADKLEKDDTGRTIIKGNIFINNSEIRYADFSSANFSFWATFYKTTFSVTADFSSATFSNIAGFNSATFSGIANFNSTTFSVTADFSSSTFSSIANFRLANFNHVDFWLATFSYADFSSANFNYADFRLANFSYGDFSSANFSDNANFWSVIFNGNAIFSDATFSAIAEFNYSHFRKSVDLDKANLNNVSPESLDSIGDAYVRSSIGGAHYFFQKAGKGYWNKPDYSKASDSFRNAKVGYNKEGKYDEAGKMYIMEKDSVRLDMKLNKSSPMSCAWLTAWKYTSNYGENPLWFIGWVAAIVLVFAIIYMPIMPDWWICPITFKEYP
jgi:uncharacterized protein YjbI with pentapeptide repeats